MVPTVAFNFRKVRRGNVTMKVWDVAGVSWFSDNRYVLLHIVSRSAQIPFHVGALLSRRRCYYVRI